MYVLQAMSVRVQKLVFIILKLLIICSSASNQAVECWLTGVEIPVGGWLPATARHLKELTEGYTLVAQVDCVDR